MRLANGFNHVITEVVNLRRTKMAWMELFTTDIGLLSLFTIGFCVAMGVFIFGYAKQHIAEDTKLAGSNKVPTP
jgi:hypothetical protein